MAIREYIENGIMKCELVETKNHMKIKEKKLLNVLNKIIPNNTKSEFYRTLTYDKGNIRVWYSKKKKHAYEYNNIIYVFYPRKGYVTEFNCINCVNSELNEETDHYECHVSDLVTCSIDKVLDDIMCAGWIE